MVVRVTLDYEFYEVLNAFPVLNSFMKEDLKLDLSKVIEGDSVKDFFEKCDLSTFEMGVVLRQMNQKVKDFFTLESKFSQELDCALVEEEYIDDLIVSADEEEEE